MREVGKEGGRKDKKRGRGGGRKCKGTIRMGVGLGLEGGGVTKLYLHCIRS